MNSRNSDHPLVRDLFGNEVPVVTEDSSPEAFAHNQSRGSSSPPPVMPQPLWHAQQPGQVTSGAQGVSGMSQKSSKVPAGAIGPWVTALAALVLSGTIAAKTLIPPPSPSPLPNQKQTAVVTPKSLSSTELNDKMRASTVYLSAIGEQTNAFGETSEVASVGTGFVVAPEVVVTDYHCVKGQANVKVHLIGSRTEYTVAKILRYDENSDKALLYVPGLQAPALDLAQSDEVQGGTLVWGLGNPGGIEGILGHGEVGGTRRQNGLIPIVMSGITHGDSGGPICNSQGEVVAVVEENNGNIMVDMTGLFYATPVSSVRALLSSIDLPKAITAARGEIS